jgi:hypothetical protein
VKRRNTLGLAAVLAIALTGIIGSGPASASSLISPEAENTTLVAGSSSTHQFKTGISFGCTGPKMEGTMSGTHVVQDIQPSSLGNYSCSYFGTPQLEPKGCQYTFHPGAETSPGVFAGTFDIGPTGCGPMTMKYLSGCTLSIYPKSGLAATFENKGSGSTASVTINAKASGLKYVDSCSGSAENGTYEGSWTLKGFNGGYQVGIHLAPPVLYVTGKESPESSQQPKFNSDFFPIGIEGNSAALGLWKVNTAGGKAECAKSNYRAATIAPLASVGFTATHQSCSAFGFATAAVNMNSCKEAFSLANSGPPYTGSFSIQCEKAGDGVTLSPKFLGSSVCTISLPAQTLGAASYTNEGSGAGRRVSVQVSGSNIQYKEIEGSTCGGSGSNGTFSMVAVLTAFDH